MELKVIKRDGTIVDFDKNKIEVAIEKAMADEGGRYVENQAREISESIERELKDSVNKEISIYEIEDKVFYKLVEMGNTETARAYEAYKSVQKYKRDINTIDKGILELLNKSNTDLMQENSNKDPLIASTQRDLIAGEVSKDIAKRMMLPRHLVEAHEKGEIHIHDLDYIIQPIFNCCLVNMKDMLDNGTVVNGKMIEQPKSFQVACNVMTQIIAQIASNQYGGQTIDISFLGKYLRKSYEKNLDTSMRVLKNLDLAEEMAKEMTQKDLESGIQTVQYQINTLDKIGA